MSMAAPPAALPKKEIPHTTTCVKPMVMLIEEQGEESAGDRSGGQEIYESNEQGLQVRSPQV